MKGYNRQKPAIAAIGAWWLSNVVVPVRGFQYGWAAERDERKGFLYTAAMEWRKTAELFASNTRAAEYCWQQWERIMRLPRRLAGPISAAQVVVIPTKPDPAVQLAVEPAITQISFAHAA